LTGEVRPLFFGPQHKVQIVGPGKEKSTFSLFDVRAFSSDGDIYHPVKGEKGYVFMKLVQPGYLSLYAFQPENQPRFDGLFFKKADGANLVVPNLGFKKYIGQFLEDCPLVVQRIKDGELGKKNLTEIVQAYNACVDGRTIDHGKVIALRAEQNTRLSAWDSLEEKVKVAEFSEKNNALEMIAEVRRKIRQQEKIPNFLLEGLKNSLQNTGLTVDLELAMKEVQ
ncbi:MAG TPA: hypothetical protein VFO54_01185, partial [Chryseosolibacter sp.]|nr:hypothetical protein [Chryseosolibacter sp.]